MAVGLILINIIAGVCVCVCPTAYKALRSIITTLQQGRRVFFCAEKLLELLS